MEPLIRVEQLVKSYAKAKRPALDGVSFEVRQGQFFALLGPNGAGKTTIISILTTTLAKTGGEARIAGHSVDREARMVRRQVVIVFQNPSLDPELTGEENIRLYVSLYGLYGYRPSYRMMPGSYKSRLGELTGMLDIGSELFAKMKTYSGGMKRKLEIVRSLMHRPKVLFLDEPTLGLDASSRKSLWRYLQEIRVRENITIFLTTHYLEEAEGADNVCVLHRGKIAMLASPDEMKRALLARRNVLLDADDRSALKRELTAMSTVYTEEEGGLQVTYREQTPQLLIAGLATPLTKMVVRRPTLEEAYLEMMDHAEGVEQL